MEEVVLLARKTALMDVQIYVLKEIEQINKQLEMMEKK